MMNDAITHAEELATHVKEWSENKIASLKLSAAEKGSGLLANLIARLLVLTLFLFFLVFAGIALALVLARVTGEYYLGFLIVSGIYALLALLCWVNKKRLLQIPLMNVMLQQFFKEDKLHEAN